MNRAGICGIVAFVTVVLVASAFGAEAPKTDSSTRLVAGIKLGVPIGASMDLVSSCTDFATESCDGQALSYDTVPAAQVPSIILDGYVGITFAETFRAGLKAVWVPRSVIENKLTNETRHLGADLQFGPFVEWAPQVNARFTWVIGAVAGWQMLFPGGKLEDHIEMLETTCAEARAEGLGCSVETGPFNGGVLGAYTGLLARIGWLKTRVDLLWTTSEVNDIATTMISDTQSTATWDLGIQE